MTVVGSIRTVRSSKEGVLLATRPTALGLVLLFALSGCEGGGASTSSGTHAPRSDTKTWLLSNVQTSPAEISVTSATKFTCGGVLCRLLGVKESADAARRVSAEEFTRSWFKSVGNHIGIYNESNPLVDDEGTAVVWIRGYDMSLSGLSEQLFRMGLVELDTGHWEDYTFKVPAKAPTGEELEDWRGILRKAEGGYAHGEKPRVLFDWPPK